MSLCDRKIKVCHLAMADLWAGAEAQLAILLASLAKMPDFEVSVVLFNEGRLASGLRDIGVKTEVISESQHKPWSLAKLLSDYFSLHQIDILHTHKYKDNILGALSSAYRGVPRRVRTIHGGFEPFVGFQAVKMRLYEIFDDAVNRWFVDRILAVSHDLGGQIVKRFGADKVICIHNAVVPEQIRVSGRATELRKELKLSGQEFLIGTMGRLMPVKGFEFFLKAARLILLERPDVKFLIAGDGPLMDSLQGLARECDLDKDVLFLGHRDDAYEIMNLLDLFVLPSLSEGVPMALLEALTLARPVVASRVGGIPEVIEHGVSGLLVTPGKEDELAKSCMALMDNYDWARRLGANGRKCVEERFSARFMAEKVAEVYRNLLSDEGS